MCSNCLDHHNAFVGTNRHTVIPIEDKGKIPKFILSLLHSYVKNMTKVHDTFTNDVQSVYSKQVSEIEKEIYILAQKRLKIQEIEEEICHMKQFSTNRQAFFGIRHFDEMLSKEVSDISKAYEKGTIKEPEIEIKQNEKLNDCMNIVDTIAEVSVQTRTRQHEFLKSGKSHLTISVAENIDRIRLELKKEIVIPPSRIGNTEIKRCLILSDGNLLFLDFTDNMRLVVLDSDGKRHKNVKFPAKPFDIDMISDKKIAVSLPSLKRIDIYESKTFNYEKCIGPLNTKCYDISFVNNNNLAVRTEKEIVILDHSVCAKIHSISLLKFLGREISYLKYHKDKFFFITDKCQIHCCDIAGDKIWTFASEDLNDARGLSTDSKGNVYTVDHQNGCVIVISADGKKSKLLPSVLFLNDLYYDKERKKLLVMLASNNENNISSALLYDVK
ncbi:unnamed protein product [Mytilus coruscus]|uniref:TRIM2_3 n=1 Tax=Mytilus coruscus TaxID=42192 RepID=A0A6J8BY92_MYTCO|nr:unnamed protein product [Mytilus coruscus]